MTSHFVKSFLSLVLVTTFGLSAVAEQAAVKSQNETLVSKTLLPPELKNLPLTLDARNIKTEKFKNTEASSIKLDKLHGPGSGGGGGLCAMNITAGTVFIKENLNHIPFSSQAQRDQFLQKISNVKFLAGANLEAKGQAVNAKNYPGYSVIVLDVSVCDQLAKQTASGYSVLLHEYLGVASIDDTTYQISASFSKKTQKIAEEEDFNLVGFRDAAIKKFLQDANNPKTATGKKIAEIQENSIDGRNQEGAFRGKINRGNIQMVLANAQDIYRVWHYATRKGNTCIGEKGTATFKVFLTWTSGILGAGVLETAEFEVSVQSVWKMPIRKSLKGLSCEDVIDPAYNDSFGDHVETIDVTEIKFVK